MEEQTLILKKCRFCNETNIAGGSDFAR